MATKIYRGVKITLSSYENGDPGIWWPLAHLEDAVLGPMQF